MRLLTQAPAAAAAALLLSILCSTAAASKKGATMAPLAPGLMCEHMVWECVTNVMRFLPDKSLNDAWDQCKNRGVSCPNGLGTPPLVAAGLKDEIDDSAAAEEDVVFDEEKHEADIAAINAYLDSDAYKAIMAASVASLAAAISDEATTTNNKLTKRKSIVFPGKKNQALSPEGCNTLLTVCPQDSAQNKEFCIRMWCEKQREAQFCDMCTSRGIEWEYKEEKPDWEWEPDHQEDWKHAPEPVGQRPWEKKDKSGYSI